MNLSVVIIEDSAGYRKVIKKYLERSDIKVLFSSDHEELVNTKPDVNPNVAIVSFGSNQVTTQTSIEYIKTAYPLTKIALLLSLYDKAQKNSLLKLPIDGLIYKASDDPGELMRMIEIVNTGEKYIR